jgi:predicted nucleotide-binding protein (sugar kinase/HSP70/actin superfamily)
VPIITTGIDNKRLHPGFKLGLKWQIDMLWGLTILDSMEMIRRRIRPYEENKGQTDHVFNESLQRIARIMPYSKRKATMLFDEFIQTCNSIPLRDIPRKPRVFIIGEILLNFHPASNGFIERYLENNGMETVFPGMVDFFRRTILMEKFKSKRRMLPMPSLNFFIQDITDQVYNAVIKRIQRSFLKFKFCEGFLSVYDLAENVKDLIDLSYCVGEGWLIPAEIIAQAKHGVNSFAILQPFGCLPNHITGRGMTKSMKKMFPHIQIVSLDYDPDTSFANVENRLQMLIIGAKEMEKTKVS